MTDNGPIILLTRPRPQAEAFRRRLGNGAEVLISPVLEIVSLPLVADPASYAGLIFTSQNAVRAAASQAALAGMRAWAVGRRTAAAARAEGLRVTSADGTADDLVALLARARPAGRLLFLRGEHSRGQVAERLNSAGIETDSEVIYRQEERPLSARALAALQGARPVILPLFSPRSARLLSHQAQGAGAPLHLVAMSPAVLAAWEGPAPASARTVERPEAEAMARAILRHVAHPP